MDTLATTRPDPMAQYDAWRVAQGEAVRLIRENRDDEAAKLLASVGGMLMEDARADVARMRYGLWLRGALGVGAQP